MPFPNPEFLHGYVPFCRIPYLCVLILLSWLSKPLLPGRLTEMSPRPGSFPAPPVGSRLTPCDVPLEQVPQVFQNLCLSNHPFTFLSPPMWSSFVFLLCLAQCLTQINNQKKKTKQKTIFQIVILMGKTWTFIIMKALPYIEIITQLQEKLNFFATIPS